MQLFFNIVFPCYKPIAGQYFLFILFYTDFNFSRPGISVSCIKIKINLNFYFHFSLWCLKMFYEGLVPHKTC